MKNTKTTKWILWTILVLGVWIIAGCGNNTPTTPDPTDVLDTVYDPGGPPINPELEPLVDAYNELTFNGGGTTYVANDSNLTIIGLYDRWSGETPQDAYVVVHTPDQEIDLPQPFEALIVLENLTYPITITALADGYVAETIVDSNANVFALALTGNSYMNGSSMVMGTLSGSFTANFAIQSTSTHNLQYQTSCSGPVPGPLAFLEVDPYRPVGAVSILTEVSPLFNSDVIPPDSDFQDPIGSGPGAVPPTGYAYANIGFLYPGIYGGWVIELDEEGEGTDRGTGNLTLDVADGDISRVTLTPGGIINGSEEFIPYYFPVDVEVTGTTGTYAITSYDPPEVFDRNVIRATVKYKNGSTAESYTTWNVGSGLPDITFGPLPGIGSYSFDSLSTVWFNADWTNDAQPGYVQVSVADSYDNTIWNIRLANDALQLPINQVSVPYYKWSMNPTGIRVSVTRVECAGFDLDNYNIVDTYAQTTSRLTSIVEPLSAG